MKLMAATFEGLKGKDEIDDLVVGFNHGILRHFTPTIAVPESVLPSSAIIATWMKYGRPSSCMTERKVQSLEILSIAARCFTETNPKTCL